MRGFLKRHWRDCLRRPVGLVPATELVVIEQGKVIGDARLAATADDRVLEGMQALHGERKPEEHWSLRQPRLRRPKKLRGTALLLAVASGNNYYHWMIESLPRLHLAEAAGWGFDQVDHVLVNQHQQFFHHETLSRLGIREGQSHPCHKHAVTTVDRLVVEALESLGVTR
ncbi:MAG: DUF563 domain-containing protein [Verrucomicrobiales bacterium]|nr:DUF563 domain-containing protein [Verrucomicrobiales bacterium]MCP5527565.1 DUF563 domain-containing protein [Verrucomicrobiales bacterium]